VFFVIKPSEPSIFIFYDCEYVPSSAITNEVMYHVSRGHVSRYVTPLWGNARSLIQRNNYNKEKKERKPLGRARQKIIIGSKKRLRKFIKMPPDTPPPQLSNRRDKLYILESLQIFILNT
jgi:hypothetical protein